MKIIANVVIKSLLICNFIVLINAHAQELNKEQVKVAYIYNFLKHINWPNEDNKENFTIAVYQDISFYNLLKRSLKNKKIRNKNISFNNIIDLTHESNTDLLYIPQKFNSKLKEIAIKVRDSETLLVTYNSSDKHNAMLNMIDSNQKEAISFEVNKSNIVLEKLTMSADLLLLGGTELDIAYLYRQTEQAMQKTRAREAMLNKKLSVQESKLNKNNTALSQLNEDLKNSALEIKKQQLAMKKLALSEMQKEKELATILLQLNKANENFAIQNKAITDKKLELSQKERELIVKENENSEMASLIKQNKIILKEQQTSIGKHKQDIEQQEAKLAQQKETILRQRTTISITTVLVIIIALVLLLVARLFIKNKKTTQKLAETIANLEETQTQLAQSEKMATLGKLIAGVAHEINTPLGIAVTSTSLIAENTDDLSQKLNNKSLNQKQLKSYINIVSKSSAISNKGLERVIELMHSFKEVAADQIIEREREINLSVYTNEVLSTLSNELKRNHIDCCVDGDQDIKIKTIPGALAQIITNLVNNSIRHGFQTTSNSILKEQNRIKLTIEKNCADEVCLTYQDNGIGMSAEVLQQVFDPFFTTKRNKGGTGLGMNIVYNIIEQKLSGKIDIKSNEGQGVTCKITLPVLLSID